MLAPYHSLLWIPPASSKTVAVTTDISWFETGRSGEICLDEDEEERRRKLSNSSCEDEEEDVDSETEDDVRLALISNISNLVSFMCCC